MSKNKYLLFSLCTLLFVGIAYAPAFAEVETDKPVYSNGDLVVISGIINFQNDERSNIVEIEIINSDTNGIVVNEYMPLDDDGSFSISYDSITWPLGDYQVIISDINVEETTEFEVSNSSQPNDDNIADNSDINNKSVYDNEQEPAASTGIPNPPTNLSATVISSTQIDLSWDAPVDDSVTGYKIEYRTNTDPTYSVVIENTDSSDTEYSHTGLNPNTVYAYRVSAINSAGISDTSSSTTVKTSDNGSIDTSANSAEGISDVPTDVTATILSSDSVELFWNPPTKTYSQTIQSYTIKQEIISNVYNDIITTSGPSTQHTISNLIPDQTYTFVVAANYPLGSSDNSDDVTITLSSNSDVQDNDSISNDISIPDRPTNLTVKPISSTQIDLSWDAPVDNSVTGYKIEYRTNTDPTYSVVIENTDSSDTEYSHTGLNPNTVYAYRVSAINEIGISESSPESTASTLPLEDENLSNDDSSQDDGDSNIEPSVLPSSPSAVKATPVSQSRIDLSWSAPIDTGASKILGYKIESKTSDESNYTVLVTNTGASITTYTHTGLAAGLTYQYRVYAINSSGEGSPSDVAETVIIPNNDSQFDSTLQPIEVTLSTDKGTYAAGESITISGTVTGSTQGMPLGLRVISSNDAIVYARSIYADNNNSFEIVIPATQSQTSIWQNSDEFTIEVNYNGHIEASVTFEIDTGATTQNENGSQDSITSETESNADQQPIEEEQPISPDESTDTNNFDNIINQNTELQSSNKQLEDENSQLKEEIEDLNKKIADLNAIIQEQINVIMNTLASLQPGN